LIDKPNGKKVFDERNYIGNFLISDLNTIFDISILNENKFDFIISNDFLEHIQNPSSVLHGVYNILNNSGKFFVSVPNWRMGHEFIYRGLFDFDNFIYFASIHGFKLEGMYQSELKCNPLPKLNSEQYLPDVMLNCWNWYLIFSKIIDD
jgi:SAM-dependent methyltransferase